MCHGDVFYHYADPPNCKPNCILCADLVRRGLTREEHRQWIQELDRQETAKRNERNAMSMTEEKKFTRGDVVANDSGPRSTRGCPLVCGSGIYDDAIVVQGDPLVLVSREGDMMWSCIGEERKFLKVTGTATEEESKAAFKRFERTPG